MRSKQVSRKAKEADILITKTIRETKALIARYYKAIADFDRNMKNIRDKEVLRIILNGTDEEKAHCKQYFVGVKGKAKSQLHQVYIANAKKKQAIKEAKEEKINYITHNINNVS